MSPSHPRPGSRITRAVVVTLMAAVAVFGCDDSSTPDEDEETTQNSGDLLGCGLVEEDLVVQAIGADATSAGRGLLPPDEAQVSVTRCDVTSVGDPDTYVTIRARYPSSEELEEMRSTWPKDASDITGCTSPWVAPGEDEYGAACVEELPEGQVTRLSSLWDDISVNVVIARPQADPEDVEIAYRISEHVAERMAAE